MERAAVEARRGSTAHAVWKGAVRSLVQRMGPFFPGDLLLEIDPRDRSVAPEFVRSHRRAVAVSTGRDEGRGFRADPVRLPVDDEAVFHTAVHLWGEREQEVLAEAVRVTGPSGKVYVLVHGPASPARKVEAWLRGLGLERVVSRVLVRTRAGLETVMVTGRTAWGEDDE